MSESRRELKATRDAKGRLEKYLARRFPEVLKYDVHQRGELVDGCLRSMGVDPYPSACSRGEREVIERDIGKPYEYGLSDEDDEAFYLGVRVALASTRVPDEGARERIAQAIHADNQRQFKYDLSWEGMDDNQREGYLQNADAVLAASRVPNAPGRASDPCVEHSEGRDCPVHGPPSPSQVERGAIAIAPTVFDALPSDVKTRYRAYSRAVLDAVFGPPHD